MVTAPEPAVIRLLPDELRTMRARIEVHAPRGPAADFWRGTLLRVLEGAEVVATCLAAFVPLAAAVEGRAQQQHHAPLSERPRVPRHVEEAAAGSDPRLPPGRPHP